MVKRIQEHLLAELISFFQIMN